MEVAEAVEVWSEYQNSLLQPQPSPGTLGASQSFGSPRNQLINKKNKKSINQSFNQSFNQSINQTFKDALWSHLNVILNLYELNKLNKFINNEVHHRINKFKTELIPPWISWSTSEYRPESWGNPVSWFP